MNPSCTTNAVVMHRQNVPEHVPRLEASNKFDRRHCVRRRVAMATSAAPAFSHARLGFTNMHRGHYHSEKVRINSALLKFRKVSSWSIELAFRGSRIYFRRVFRLTQCGNAVPSLTCRGRAWSANVISERRKNVGRAWCSVDRSTSAIASPGKQYITCSKR